MECLLIYLTCQFQNLMDTQKIKKSLEQSRARGEMENPKLFNR